MDFPLQKQSKYILSNINFQSKIFRNDKVVFASFIFFSYNTSWYCQSCSPIRQIPGGYSFCGCRSFADALFFGDQELKILQVNAWLDTSLPPLGLAFILIFIWHLESELPSDQDKWKGLQFSFLKSWSHCVILEFWHIHLPFLSHLKYVIRVD